MSKKILIDGGMKELSLKPDMIYIEDIEPMIITDPYRGLPEFKGIDHIKPSGQQLRRERRKKNRKKK